ncbi:GNAT family N-acetyltransferase [Roseateles sp. BYS180W]|uniref:GNAT family N-acetyltransferase n=1 Tax=Roseateles rivi TaxID=3299028 RepID=A0ABW7FVL8_9BURK
MDFTLRRATADDASAMADLMAHPEVQPQLLQLPHAAPAHWRQRLGEVQDPQNGDLQLLAVRGSELLGSAGVHKVSARQRLAHVRTFGMAVHPNARRQGVGNALLGTLVDYAQQWLGCRRLELTVFCDNTPALTLYERHGFEIEGRLRAYALRQGRLQDVFVMSRLFDAPARA